DLRLMEERGDDEVPREEQSRTDERACDALHDDDGHEHEKHGRDQRPDGLLLHAALRSTMRSWSAILFATTLAANCNVRTRRRSALPLSLGDSLPAATSSSAFAMRFMRAFGGATTGCGDSR